MIDQNDEINQLPVGYDPYRLGLPKNDCFKCVKLKRLKKDNKILETCPYQDDALCPYNESGLFGD